MNYEKTDMKAQKRSKNVRLLVLVAILLFSTSLGITHQFSKGWLPPGVDAFCPFGGVESAFSLFLTGKLLNRIAWSSFILLLATLIVVFIFRRSFCGNICPLGTLQELFGKLGNKIFRKRFQPPSVIDKPGRYLKYLALLVFVILTAITGELAIRKYDPWVAYQHLTSPDLFKELTIGFIVLVGSLLGSMAYNRLFCRYLCPMGAFLGLINRIGLYRVKRNEETCIECKACNRACPVDIPVMSLINVQSSECLNCNECVNSCPVKETLYVSGPRNSKVTPFMAIWITVAIFAAVTGIASFTGGFEWSQPKLAERAVQGQAFDPLSIKGSDTFRDVSAASGVSKELIMRKFKISNEEFEKPVRDAVRTHNFSFETEDLRKFIKEQLQSK